MSSKTTSEQDKPVVLKKQNATIGNRQRIGLWAGPLVFLVVLLLPAPEGMGPEAKRMAAIAALMAIWWISESVPIPATSLLPIVLFPLLGIMPTGEATTPYASHLIFLFMGGFIIALAMQRWNLHRRIALCIIYCVGFSPGRLVFGFMLATAVLSAFVSNTATAVMMMPIGLAVMLQTKTELEQASAKDHTSALDALGVNLMLGIAYAASIGGVATLIGTPPNTVLASYLSSVYNYEIGFAHWLLVGMPLVIIFLPLSWWWLTRIANPMPGLSLPGGKQVIEKEIKEMGSMSPGERWTAVVFGLTALGWISRPYLADFFIEPKMIKDATIAMLGALVLFVIPVNLKKHDFVMNWEWASKLPWGVLVLFGGGLSLATGFQKSGLVKWIVDQIEFLSGMPIIALIFGITIMVIFLTELTSNTATASMLMPVLGGIAIGLEESPLLLLAPAALSASFAFMLPVATPPNAIVFGSGCVTIPQMVRSGLGLNIIGIILVTLAAYFILIPAFGIVVGELPDWVK
ncbi:DASS family sodium-coupled anion symporter [Rubellicoccus peritrichatus]|uniref:DASS family sodium-coupled anion symporter n=1 Tax=Rubellicoccus peritrichatus TaxID=3080537 RepID=A0AAQ3QX41_9BACT|nr:DASS family sodium-coupled anion symporter [Puniceicoccus sp. CR14]WOO42495.1 DASS family sodium-coupled anion symporter [Puniceicoccus sp. CR14]